MTTRVCWPAFDDAFRVKDGQIVGPVSVFASLLMERLRGLNLSIVRESTIGGLTDYEKHSYDGCIGSLQRNETDAIFFPTLAYPVLGPNLKQGVVDGYHKVGIVSAYNRSDVNINSHTHVMDMVLTFSPGLWVLTISMLCLLSSCLWKSMLVKGKGKIFRRKKTMYCLIACILKQHSAMQACPRVASFLSLYYLMATFGFLIGLYLTSMIKTEMVLVEPPTTVQNYDEIIASGRRPLWASIFADWQSFKFAKRESKERKIWDIGVKMGINDSILQNNGPLIVSHAIRIAERTEVALFIDMIGEYALREGCAFSRSKEFMLDTNALFKIDDSAPQTLQGNVYNSQMSQVARMQIEERTQLAFEAGLLHVTGRFIDLTSIFGKDLYAKHTSITECASNVVIVPHPEYKSPDPLHYVSLFYLSLGLLICSLFLLILEVYRKTR